MEETIFNYGESVDLLDMLKAREERAKTQQTLLDQIEDSSLLVMTMAIPGPIKTNNILNQAFDSFLDEVRGTLSSEHILKELKQEKHTGLEYFALSTLPPYDLKALVVEFEEEHVLGRLFDLDVMFLDENDAVVGTSRTEIGLPVRSCFICNRSAKVCGRSRRHTVEELQQEISTRVIGYIRS